MAHEPIVSLTFPLILTLTSQGISQKAHGSRSVQWMISGPQSHDGHMNTLIHITKV